MGAAHVWAVRHHNRNCVVQGDDGRRRHCRKLPVQQRHGRPVGVIGRRRVGAVRGDQRPQLERARLHPRHGRGEHFVGLREHRLIPQQTVLIFEQDGVAASIDSGGHPCTVERFESRPSTSGRSGSMLPICLVKRSA